MKQANRVTHYYSFYHDFSGKIKISRERFLAEQVKQYGFTAHEDGVDRDDAEKVMLIWNKERPHYALTREIPEHVAKLTS